MRDDDIWHLKRLNFFPELTPEQKVAVEDVAQTISYKKDDAVYFPGQLSNFVYVVREGMIRITKATPRGSFITLDILSPGDIFGEMALAGQDRQSDSAEAMRDSNVWAIPREALVAVVMSNPTMALQITKIIGFRRWQVENKVTSLLCTVPVRLARLVLSLADRYPCKLNDGRRYAGIRLTHKDYGELIGANREIVTATLSKFKQSGLIDLVRGYIVICDERKVIEAAQWEK